MKLCDASLCKPLELIFKCLESGKFPLEWKKGNVVPAHENGDKQILENYRRIFLLPITGKIFERILYNNMFQFFSKNDLISHNQSGFKPGDSCINQLLSIIHEMYKSFDDRRDVRTDFLNSRNQRVALNGQFSSWTLVLKQGYLKDRYSDHYYF